MPGVYDFEAGVLSQPPLRRDFLQDGRRSSFVMAPFPTLQDVARPIAAPREMHERCFGASASPFTCVDSGEVENDGEESNSTDMSASGRQDGMATASALSNMEEKTDVMSLDRLFCPLSRQCGDTCRRGRSAVSMVRRNKANGAQPILYTDVVVVGNGPSALALSSFLAGYRPYYEGAVQHPDASLHEKLEINKSKSLLEQDLSHLCESLEGRTTHQVSLLYDYLVRPEADFCQENPSTLTWRRDETNDQRRCQGPTYVPHVVLGKGAVGGTWADLAPEVMTLSFASWLDLPAYSFREWLVRDGANFATDLQMKIDATKLVVGRVPCAAVRRYYRDYVRALGLDENIFEYALVTSVRKRKGCRHENGDPDGDIDPEYGWDVHGCYSGGSFHFRCRRVVLATGVTVPRQLGIPGEDDPRVLHSAAQLDRAVQELLSLDSSSLEHGHRKRAVLTVADRRLDPVLIIGDGLNAADAVIRCLINGISVVHSFRKTPKDSKQVLSKLSKILYPEYHTVFQLMTGASKDPLYSVYARTQVQRFELFDQGDNEGEETRIGGVAFLRHLKSGSVERIRFSRVAVLIGFEADLSFLDTDNSETEQLAHDRGRPVDSKTNTLDVDPFTYRCINEPDLYAVGPLVGDNFVRYVVGGSMAVAADILRRKH